MSLSLAITGAGLVTSVGAGLAGSCAALRAQVSAPAEVVAGGIVGEDDSPPVVGHPSRFATGFFQSGLWVRLASLAAADLLHRAEPPLRVDAWSRAGMLVLGPRISEERFGWSLDDEPQAQELYVGRPLAKLLELPVVDASMHGFSGHEALAASLAAVAGQQRRDLDRFLVAAADSLTEPMGIGWLRASGRLKDPDNSTGFMPGEAGAALLLETDMAARLRQAEVLGHVEAVAVGGPIPPPPRSSRPSSTKDDVRDGGEGENDDRWLPPSAPRLGRAIADTVRKVLPPTAAGTRWAGDLYLDLNGEYWRSEAWGHAIVHLVPHVDLDACRIFLPADSLGETGAASASVAVAFALWNFDRDRTDRAIVVSVADDGATGAIRLSAPRPASPAR